MNQRVQEFLRELEAHIRLEGMRAGLPREYVQLLINRVYAPPTRAEIDRARHQLLRQSGASDYY